VGAYYVRVSRIHKIRMTRRIFVIRRQLRLRSMTRMQRLA
jgi:hypothetical protein